MNSPRDGAGAPEPGTGPKHGRKRSRYKRRRGKNGRGNPSENVANANSVKDESRPGSSDNGVRQGSGSSAQRPMQGQGQHRNNRANGVASGGARPLYAALDLGTNNCRLLIATPVARRRFRVVDGFSRIVRLGEGLSRTGRLGDEAMDRAIEALKVCAGKLNAKSIKSQRLIATEACRQAENGELFIERVRNETGLDLEIVSREMEAQLAAEGCGTLVDRESDAAVLFDIGGGSSELILVNREEQKRRKIRDQIVAWTSLPLGVVTLAEKFGGKDVTRSLFDEMVAAVMLEIEAFSERDKLDRIFKNGNAHLLGTSGTVTTLAGIHLKLAKYDRRQVDGIWLSDLEMDQIITELLEMDFAARAAHPCIGNERADLVLAGCAILNAIRLTWPAKRLRVADRGLREGLLTEMMFRDGSWRRNNKKRWSRKRRMKRDNSPQNQKGDL